ncbi:hypothetical protein B0T19DRAFT_269382 [Cercophora scortea]|uniref:Rhodopsin domain-containing protein n=1 Tax=Cercophora scortea TaxID=314031 RepID=A0AAE0M6D9_9PEZI|nr:hypothetical protein B0T19DRAFT_269382 [Cercophora scortea]
MLAREVATMQSRATTIYGFMGAFVPLAFMAVCLRLYTRFKFAKIGGDDIAITIGFVGYTGLMIATIYAVKYGLGLHIWDVPMETGVSMQKCGFTSQVLYPSSLGAIKLSIILFLLRVLPADNGWTKPLYGLAGWVVASESAFTIALFLQCRPINFYWDKTVEGSCFDQPKFYYVDAALNMTTDIVILSLPWFIFRNLNLSKRKKYELLLICSVGVFTLISSIVRLPYLHNLNQSLDPTWDVVDICIWSIAELGSAITLSSVPAIRPLIVHHFPRYMGTLLKGSTGGGSGINNSGSHRHGGASTGGGTKKTTTYPGSEAADQASAKPSWFSYTELEDVDGSLRKKRSADMESQEHILEHEPSATTVPAGVHAGGRAKS